LWFAADVGFDTDHHLCCIAAMNSPTPPIGILGYGLYIPTPRHTAKDVAAGSAGRWTEQAVKEKLGLHQKPMPGPEDGTQEMGVRAALDALKRTGVKPDEIDLILCMGEEYKEYPLTTSGIYIQEAIGARRAWAIDVQQRCNTTVAALKIARDMMLAEEELNTVMIVGGYRNGDLIDYADPTTSFMYNLAAGAGAFILRKGHNHNVVLACEIATDGSMARDVGLKYGGTVNPIEKLPPDVLATLREHGNKTLTVMQPEHMKDSLNAIGFTKWLMLLDKALTKSQLTRKDIGYLNILHFKPSMHASLLDALNLREENSFYLQDYGHLGQVDPMLSIHEGLKAGRLKDGQVMAILTAGIGYVWGVALVRWG
jgi:3-oxoacyl-[acyl-carrier-protein] synthase-3